MITVESHSCNTFPNTITTHTSPQPRTSCYLSTILTNHIQTFPHKKSSLPFPCFCMKEFRLWRWKFPTSLFFLAASFLSLKFLSCSLNITHTRRWRDGSFEKKVWKELTLLTDIWNLISHQVRLRNKTLSSSATSCFCLWELSPCLPQSPQLKICTDEFQKKKSL